MSESRSLGNAKRVGTGLCFIVFPLTFVFAFAVHPGLLDPRILSPEELILRGWAWLLAVKRRTARRSRPMIESDT